VLTACWSVKGGTGTTLVAAALVLGAAGGGRPVVGVDFAGDLPAALGFAESDGPGVLDWLDAGAEVPRDALGRIAHDTSHGITLVRSGTASTSAPPPDASAGHRLAKAIRNVRAGGPVIADCGRLDSPAKSSFVEAADRSLLVLRPCYLALRKAHSAPRPTAVVLIGEPNRSLCGRDIEDVLGVPVVAEIAWDPEIATAVDRGLLSGRLPRRLRNAIGMVAA
jgi:MinD-like ATPase involved in chromosome partitioning or flagellar assembly